MSVVDRSRTPPVRTPDPLAGSRRRALRRLGSKIRAMPLGPIGDIGSNAFGTVQTATWDTAADWDAAVDENGIVHSTYPGSDRTDSEMKLGYDVDALANLVAYWPHDEDSGTTVNDVSGNNYDGSLSGISSGGTGVFNSTTFSYDGVDDFYDVTGTSATTDLALTDFTVNIWFKTTGLSDSIGVLSNKAVVGSSQERNWWLVLDDANGFSGQTGSIAARVADGTSTLLDLSSLSDERDGNWHMATLVVDSTNGDGQLYVDGSQVDSGTFTGSAHTDTSTAIVCGNQEGETRYWNGDLDEHMIFNTPLSSTQVADLYLRTSTNFLTTATKTLSTPSQPDLQNLDYDLNGESISLDVIGSPGEAGEETVTQSLTGATSYSLTWSSSHTDFRVEPTVSTTTETASPAVRAIEIVG